MNSQAATDCRKLPYCSLNDHTLAVTDFAFSCGTFPICRLYSTSMDGTCKVRATFDHYSCPSTKPQVWEIRTGKLSASVLSEIDCSVTHVSLDPSNRSLYVSCARSDVASKTSKANISNIVSVDLSTASEQNQPPWLSTAPQRKASQLPRG